VLTVSDPRERTRQISPSERKQSVAERWLSSYRKLRQKLGAIGELNGHWLVQTHQD
jgi:hypothetical protein